MLSRKMAFTLIEMLSCLVIISVMAAILFPTISSAKMSAKVTSASASLRNLYIATMLYRSDYEGAEYGKPASMGLPDPDLNNGGNPALVDIYHKVLGNDMEHYSPCGRHFQPQNYTVLAYMPSIVDDWANWVNKLESRTILFADSNCNTADVDINDQYAHKRSIGVALDGHIVVRFNEAHYWLQEFYL